jgi:hypothetical protein
MSEHDLLKKLIAKWHLSVPDRRALPNQAAKVSILVKLIAEIVTEHGWIPRIGGLTKIFRAI